MVMPEWGWLSRGTLLGVVGTVALVAFFSVERPKTSPGVSNAEVTPSLTASANRSKRIAVPMLATLASYAQPQAPTTGKGFGAQAAQAAAPEGEYQAPAAPIIPSGELFATPVSLGMLAIGAAEGNYRVFREKGTLYVEQTPLYFGHTDPGNFATNYGPCSDQGRSRGDINLAAQMCVERSRRQLPVNVADLLAVGIDANRDPEALINAADLYNQASEIHSRRFPQALTIARRGGLSGLEAIAWARTASFYLNDYGELDIEKGANRAGGLLGICSRENRAVTEWECVYHDQMRRARAISEAIAQYFQIPDSAILVAANNPPVGAKTAPNSPPIAYKFPTQGRVRKGYSITGKQKHPAIDIAAAEGTPIIAAAKGKVIAAGVGDEPEVVRAAGQNWGKALVLVISHDNGDRTIYAHNQRHIVKVGQKVTKGQTVALVGQSGNAEYPHLHFELKHNGQSVNPLSYVQFN